MIRRALVSVSDKSDLVPFVVALRELGVEIISTGGTARELQAAGVDVTPVETVTGVAEMMDGRVKTLHPAIHGALLADRSRPEHMAALSALGAAPIDLVIVNLYPFAATVARPGVTDAEAIENIDIGGPSMLRSAAKNWASVAVVCSPADYDGVLVELRANDGRLSDATRRRLAQQAFAHTAAYDAAIAAYFVGTTNNQQPTTVFPDRLVRSWVKRQELRYGENPHQAGAFYVQESETPSGVAAARQLHGMELSYINFLDLDAAWELVSEFAEPAAAIIKHTNPCGCGIGATLVEAYERARDGELPPFNPPGSRFGGIIAFNRAVDRATAESVIAPKSFYHAIIAPDYDPDALDLLQNRAGWGVNLRLLSFAGEATKDQRPTTNDRLTTKDQRPTTNDDQPGWRLTSVGGGVLVQEADRHALDAMSIQVVTRRAPTETELRDLLFAWRVVKHVKSNAIVLAKDGQVIGVGAGQMNRALPVELAVAMAGDRVTGSALASDAFFPHPDGPAHAARAGVTAIIQPGGSNRDADAVAVADEHGLAMVFTGVRHFRH